MIYTFFTCFYYVFDLESWPDLSFNRNIIHTICFNFYKYIIQQWNTMLSYFNYNYLQNQGSRNDRRHKHLWNALNVCKVK